MANNKKIIDYVNYFRERNAYERLRRNPMAKDLEKLQITFTLTNPKIIDLFLELLKTKEFKMYNVSCQEDDYHSFVKIEVAD